MLEFYKLNFPNAIESLIKGLDLVGKKNPAALIKIYSEGSCKFITWYHIGMEPLTCEQFSHITETI